MDHDNLTTAFALAAPLCARLAVHRDMPGPRTADATAGAARSGGASRCGAGMAGIDNECGRPAAPGEGM